MSLRPWPWLCGSSANYPRAPLPPAGLVKIHLGFDCLGANGNRRARLDALMSAWLRYSVLGLGRLLPAGVSERISKPSISASLRSEPGSRRC